MIIDIYNIERIIKVEKIDNYLLSSVQSKGKYFLSKDFNRENLNSCLMKHLSVKSYKKEIVNAFGTNFVFEGKIICPNNQVTAYRIQK